MNDLQFSLCQVTIGGLCQILYFDITSASAGLCEPLHMLKPNEASVRRLIVWYIRMYALVSDTVFRYYRTVHLYYIIALHYYSIDYFHIICYLVPVLSSTIEYK